jgi:hypothetical protein
MQTQFFQPVTTALVSRKMDIVNVKAHGVTGSGDDIAGFQAAIQTLRDQGGGVMLIPPGLYSISSALLIPSNVTVYAFGAEVTNTALSGWDAHCVLWGQCNREDIARSKGVEETAHSLGTLSAGDNTATIGQRWNNAGSAFSNAANYTPLAGDTVIVCTTDDIASPPDATRPLPSYTHHRKIVKVDGSDVTFDKGVGGSGTFMLIPACRDLGYDRTTYGGLGRVETLKDSNWFGGKLISQNGFPIYHGASIGGDIVCDVDGKSLIYGNGMRETRYRINGKHTLGAIEVAFGSELPEIECVGSHDDDGSSYTTALLQVGENPFGVDFKKLRLDGSSWDGNDAVSITGSSHKFRDAIIASAAAQRLLVVGSSNIDVDDLETNRLEISTSATATGRLVEVTGTCSDIVLDLVLRGNTSNADAVNIDGDGEIKKLHIVDDGGAVRIPGDYKIANIDASGTQVINSKQTHIEKSKIRGNFAEYLESEGYAAAFTPTESFIMTMTGNVDLDDPGSSFEKGDQIRMIFQQDGTGGRSITFAAGNVIRGIAAPGSGTASQRFSMTLEYTGSVWMCVASNGGWA